MKLKVKIGQKYINLNVGNGYGDFRWLSLASCYQYGKIIYPRGRYLPVHLLVKKTNKQGQNQYYEPHPLKQIFTFLQGIHCQAEQATVIVKVRRGDHRYEQQQLNWQRLAFGQYRSMMDIYIRIENDKLTKRRQYKYRVQINYVMNQQIMSQFLDSTQFKPRMDIVQNMKQKILSQSKGEVRSQFQFKISLPFGQIRHCLLYQQRDEKTDQIKKSFRIQYLGQGKTTNYLYVNNPSITPKKQIQQLVKNNMRMPEQLSKQLQLQQLQNKHKAGKAFFCCYTGQRLWQIIQQKYDSQLDISCCDQPIKDKVSISISKYINKLYQIFFQYVITYYQQRSDKQDLCISFQDIQHFIKFYQILPDSASIQNFFQIFNQDDRIIDLADTLDLDKGVKFPQFIMIILKVVHFINTSHMQQGKTFDSAVDQIFSKIVKIDANQQQFNQFHKTMRENVKLINYIRQQSQKFMSVFIQRLQNTPHVSASKYHMLFQDIKGLVAQAGFDVDSVDQIVHECYKQLFSLKPKYKNFQGIYFYEFLQVLQWLSHVLTGLQQQDFQEDSIQALINKLNYFLGHIYNEKPKH